MDNNLRLDVIHSDPEAFYISMDMDPRGNLYVGGRDAVYLFEADGKGGFKARRTITTLPKHTWAYSLQVAGDDLYVLTVTALYRLPNVVRDPGKVTFERLVWGIPLGHIHQGFHGMRMGPDGRLVLAFGDPQPGPFRSKTNPGHVWHWTFLSGPRAKKHPWTGVGGVIRYDPKTHAIEVISRGHRNICDLAVDETWNLFGNDNDQEGSPLHTFGRLTHITEGSHYQWSRGWLEVKEPYRNDLIRTIVPDLGRFVPFGTCYYNEDHLGNAYKRSLFVARWGSRELGQFPLTARGSTFDSKQTTLIAGRGEARPVAVFTGNDGRLFVSVCYMQRNEASPVKRTDLAMLSNPKVSFKTNAYDPASASVGRLLDEIESDSWKRRFNAHREIVGRGFAKDTQVVDRFVKGSTAQAAWHSLAWLAGHSKDARVATALNAALKSPDARVAATAADVLRRFYQLDGTQIETLIAHRSPVVQLAALRNLPPSEQAELIDMIEPLAHSDDTLARQLAMRILSRVRSFEQLEKQFNAGDLPTRRVAMAAAMWKWIDTVESGIVPKEVKLSKAAAKALNGFAYVDDAKTNLMTESRKHGFIVGGLPLMNWWRQTSTTNPAAPVLQRMIAKAIDDPDDAHRKTAAVFANTLGLDELASRVPGLAQTRSAKAKLVKGAKLSANKAMPPAYRKINWQTAWKQGTAPVGAKLFKERCVACHDSGKGGGIIGPSLAGVADRFTPQYLAESVVVPSKDISPNFQTWTVTTRRKNQTLMGFLSGEDENRLTLQMMDGSLKAVEKSDITAKAASDTSLMPIGLITGPEELKHVVRYLMTLKTSTGGPPSNPRAEVTRTHDSVAVDVFRQVNPLAANEFRFAPIEARFVRVRIYDTNRGQPCIDELEVFSPGSSRNVALQSNGAKAAASSLLKGYSKHKIGHLNDGRYGNLHSWIPAERTGWAQIELPKSMTIDRVVLSRDRGGELTRRNPIAFDILVSSDGKKWNVVKKARPPKAAAPPSATTGAEQGEDGFRSIFNGEILDKWDHRKGAWEIVDGAISCTGVEKTRNWIIWRGGTPSDFVLRLDFKYEAGNSGVQVRSDDQGDHQVFGYQVEIAAQDKMGLWHHSLLPKDDPAREARHLMATAGQEVAITAEGNKSVKQVAAAEKIVAHFKQDGWNSMEIIAVGNTLTQKINGVVFSKVSDDDKRMSRRKGVIALQDHGKGCKVAFQNIRLKELPVKEQIPLSDGVTPAPAPAPAKRSSSVNRNRPNIVLILADDFGWGDASCNNPDSPIKTPHIDRIAKEGIRFTNAHTPSAVCTPTRYGLLTGRYPWRSYLKKEVLRYYAPALITKGRTTLPSYLKSQGYRTGGFGKWHLGLDWTPVKGDPLNWRTLWNSTDKKDVVRASKGIDHSKPFKNSPVDIGFDTYFGTPSNASRLPFFIRNDRVVGNPQRSKNGMLRDPACARDKVDDIYVAKAIGFIESHEKQHADRPFFIYLPLNAIHGAVTVPKRFAGKNGMSNREDKILWANESVGRILAALDRMKLTDDTLLIFTTDNGPLNSPTARKKGHRPTGPYRGLKTEVWDGGTRVPFVARWPGHIPQGATTDHLIGLTDILATVAALCGEPLPKGAGPDSVNQLPALLQQRDILTKRPPLVTASYLGFLTIRNDKWKAVFGTKWAGGFISQKYGVKPPKGTPPDDPAIGQLYSLLDDPLEQEDLWESRPGIVKKLRLELEGIKRLDKSDEVRW
ncbi:MAG: sulfatase-like hydrolase/transferase [Phycisphaerae bacterium]|nr:sulfatase-like hydrolase/transferase [Phycisphaerae bacterium]